MPPDAIFWAALGGSLGGGLVALIIQGLHWYFDRPLLKCALWTGRTLDEATGKSWESVTIEAINPHSKPLKVSGYGFIYKDKQRGLILDKYEAPYSIINGYDSFSKSIPMTELFDIFKKSKKCPNDIQRIWFKAKSGKQFSNNVDKRVITLLQKKFDKEKN